ncbi:MAG: hypothetical protein HUU38_13635 [Anaerolineales bacterium]|nr:hypothetical protein [Anaerolineales bacterium]
MLDTGACPPASTALLDVEILDANGDPISALTTNEEGWYTPNPLTVQITIANTQPEELNGAMDFIFGSPNSSTRFYVVSAPEACSFASDWPYTNQTYVGSCNVLILTGELPQTLTWEVWLQPSTEGPFDVNAELLVDGNPIATDTDEVDLPQAAINPVIFIHGILGSMPPGQHLWTSRPTALDIQIPSEPVLDPFLESYYPMVDHLEKMGYEWGTTLFALAYDWRDDNDDSATFLGNSIVSEVLPSASQLPYVASNPQVDLVVHSMGGLVSRACTQNENSNCHGNVHKIIFIASPHQGFESDYRTREGLTWGDYFGHEVPGGADLWFTMQPFMDFLLWPRMIRLQYNPTSQEIEEDCLPSFPLGNYDCSIAHYEWAHDPARGIVSLSQMLPTTDLLDENYITNIFDQQQPWPCTAGVKPSDLENDWLETLNANISQLVTELGEENIYVLYSEEFGNLTDRQYPAICVIHPYGQWPYGWPITEVEIPADFGDDLIPVESTTLRRSGLLLIPLANETIIDEFGHKGIAYAPAAQQKVTEYLTGGQISSGTTPYHYPNALENLARIIAVFVTTDGGENLGESGSPNLPVQIMITDPGGQQFGYDPVSATMMPGIPGAFYSGSLEPQFMVLFNTLPGDYQITVTGIGDADYEMETYVVEETGLQLLDVFTGTVTTGQVITHTAAYTVSAETLFFDDMESGGNDWTAEGGWSLDADTAYSPITSWASGMITPSMPQTITLEIPLDLSTASVASLTFWHTYTLSSQAQAFVEASTDGGITWQAVITYQNETHEWTPLVMSLTPFTGPEYDPLQLRFRLVSTHPGDQWRIDDVRVETIAPPTLFALPFEDNVESWRKWEGEGGWVRTHTLYTSPDTAWQSSTPGATLSLAGNLDLQTSITPALTFWYSMTVDGAGVIEVLPAGESIWQTAETLTETTGWTQAEVDLSPWTGITATLRLRQTGQPGAVWTVDDFLVQEVIPPVIHLLPFTDDMEIPTANWQAINAWEPVTSTAHSGTTAWLGETSGSALMLIDQLDLSDTTSPILSFSQQFALPNGTFGQVRVRSETDLIWRPVLTVTNPISGWTPINVDLSAYAGEKIELAFVVNDAPVGEGGQTSQTTPGLPPVAVGLSFLAIAVLGIAQITSEPENRSRLRKVLNIGVWIGIVWACLYFSGVLWSIPFYRAWRINHLNVVEGGKVELLVSASQKPAGAELSPGGKWMLVDIWENASSISDTRLLIDLIKNGTYTILLENTTHLRWLDDDLFMGEHSQRGFFIVTIPEEEKTYLREKEVSANSDELLALQHSQKLYAIEESGGYNFINLDGDMLSIYMISTLLSFDEHKELLMAFPNAKIISRDNRTLVEEKVGATGSIRHLRVYSPDGSLYAENSPGSSPFLQIFSTQGDVLLARVQKRGYAPTLLGWSSDGRGFYFELLTGGLGEVLAPERSVFLLRLDDAGSNVTGLKVGGGAQLEFASIAPVSFSLSPVQLSLAPGWYIDDVSVFDAPPTPTPTTTPTSTPTSTSPPTDTPTPTETPTSTPTSTPTPTNTPPQTPTPSPTPSDLIFADSFESGDFSAWSSYTASSDLQVTSDAALLGNYGLRNTVNANGMLYVQDDSPNSETEYHARFYLDPNGIQMNTGTHAVFLASGEPVGATTNAVQVLSGKASGETGYKIRVAVKQDNGNWLYSLNYPITDAPHAIEIYWQAASVPGANDGIIQLWIDGEAKYLQTALDNDTFHIDLARLGVVRNPDIETVGSHCLDAFESRRSTYIGLISGSTPCAGTGPEFPQIPPGSPENLTPETSQPDIPTPGGLLFADGFESGDYSAWDYHSPDPDLSVANTAAITGTYGLSVQVDDSRPVFVRDDTPAAEIQYSARFYLDPHGLWLNGGNHTIFQGLMAPNTSVFTVDLGHQPDTNEYQLMLQLKVQGGEWMLTPGFTISDAPHAVEVHWGAASAPDAADGWVQLWLDGGLVYEHAQLANAGLQIDSIRLGAVYAPLPGATGVYCLDEFVSATGEYIGMLELVNGCGGGGSGAPEARPANSPRKWPLE